MNPLRILTWHVHGNYLYSLTQLPHTFTVPVMTGRHPGYEPPGPHIRWGNNLRSIPADQVRHEEFDCIIYQSDTAFRYDRQHLLNNHQQRLPSVYIEHNPPEPHPTDSRHCFQHDHGVLVHVTHFNALMWDAGDTPVRVIEHGVPETPGVHYSGEVRRGITVINHLGSRGRRLGADIYGLASHKLPLDLIGMESTLLKGGQGEVINMYVPAYVARYRFLFSPARYASLGLSIVEAMLAGVPVVGIAATELGQVIQNGVNGYVDYRPAVLFEIGQQLLNDRDLAWRWGQGARLTARRRFGIQRFVQEWQDLLTELTGSRHHD